MTARIYFDSSVGSNVSPYVEVDGRLRLLGWEVREQAEEGSAAMSTVAFDDPSMDWDVTPWSRWYLVEDESVDDNSVICGGWITEQEIGREGGDLEKPLARIWAVSLTDANTYWAMRVMVGSDANRPAETDVERMQWLLATNEVAWAYDTTTYVQTTTPVAMDAVDYRGQYLNQIMDDCAQASGRNWYAWIDLVAGVRKVMVWYGHDTWAVRDSPLALTNDLTEITVADVDNGTSIIYPISEDTKLKRDPSRMYDGVYLERDGGAIYRDTDPRTVRRDFISPSYNVKSLAKAEARAARYLADLDEQDEVVTTSVELPAARVTQLRAGMRVPLTATHLPGYADGKLMRVLSCVTKPIAQGDWYRLELELAPVGAVGADVFAVLYQPHNNQGDAAPQVNFNSTGDNPDPGYETLPLAGPLAYVTGAGWDGQYTYEGIEVTGTGTIDVTLQCNLITVIGPGTTTATFEVRLNGSVVGSATDSKTYSGYTAWSTTGTVTVSGLAVVPGDVITATADTDNAFFNTYVPVGTGIITNRLDVTGSLA